jgi:hypothetical protein
METATAAREKRRQTALNGENPFLPADPWAATEKYVPADTGAQAAFRKNLLGRKCRSHLLKQAPSRGLKIADAKAIHAQVSELNLLIWQMD